MLLIMLVVGFTLNEKQWICWEVDNIGTAYYSVCWVHELYVVVVVCNAVRKL